MDDTTTASGGASVSLDWSNDEPGKETSHLLSGLGVYAGEELIVAGHGRIQRQHNGPLVAHRSVLEPADVDALGSAARDRRRCCAEIPEQIYLANGDLAGFDPELFERDPVSIEIGEGQVCACVDMLLTRTQGEQSDYLAWLEPAARGHKCQILSVRLTDEDGNVPEDIVKSWPPELAAERDAFLAQQRDRPRIVEVFIAPREAMTVGDLLAAGSDVRALLAAFRGGPINATTARNLILAGRPHLLVGQEESEWLEVKGHPYSLKAEGNPGLAAKIELAQDVARFANGHVSALLVVGLSSGKEDGRDVIRAVTAAKLSTLSPDQHRNVIDAHVHPTVDGLTVETVDVGAGKGLLLIGIPSQPDEYKPFLVHGAIVGGRAEGAFISIVRRRGEGSITTTASQIHAMLTTGRALLREMSSDRLSRTEQHLRSKSEAAAAEVLTAVRQADDESSRPPATPQDYFHFDRSLQLAEEIRRHAWGILDDEVRGRVERCRSALFSFGTNWVTFEGDREAATLVLKGLVRDTRLTLEAYLAEKILPRWAFVFDASESYDWLVRTSGPRRW